MNRITILIAGEVQGVGYRAWIVRQALDLTLTGWVRNNTNGTVELIVEGERLNLKEFMERCKQGPAGSSVRDIQVSRQKETGEFGDFKVIY